MDKQRLYEIWSTIKLYLKEIFQKIKVIFHRYQILKFVTAIILSLFLFVSVYMTFVAKTMNIQDLHSSLEHPTVIYDSNNNKASSLYTNKGNYVGLDKISKNVPNAVLSTEDQGFYHEHGFSVKGFGRAALLMVKNRILHRDYISGGGSTITQQLVKNTYLTQEQTFTRKFKELFMSIQVTNVYSKNDILSMYLNKAYFGNGVYGIEDAAKRYFGTSADNLSVSDSAVLAGMLTNPTAFNPVDNPNLAQKRRNVVLSLMVQNNKLSNKEAEKYYNQPIRVKNTYVNSNQYRYPYYSDSVINEAINKYKISESDIMNGGYKIYTYLDPNQQSNIQTRFENPSLFPANASDGTPVQAASIAVNSKNGGVTAVVGGRGEHVFRGYNRANQIQRQPGSLLKPLSVYTPALENGYNYDSNLSNRLQSFGTNHYSPKNYNNMYSDNMPMYQAVTNSLNVPAVWLLDKLGVDRGYQATKRFGLPLTSADRNLSLALGGMENGVSPQQMAGAYTAFSNGGYLQQPHYIQKIVAPSGRVIVDNHDNSGERIMSSDTAKQMTSMLLDVFNSGTGVNAKPYGYQIAGKTGSTEADNVNDVNATRDKWIVGYTPDEVVTTWEGFDNVGNNHHLENLSGNGISPLFKSELEGLLPYTKQTNFDIKSAQSLEWGKQNREKNSNSESSWDKFKNGVNDDVDSIKRNTNNWFNNAKKFFNK